jgi:tetratricopeptide (TPR) repeat protein
VWQEVRRELHPRGLEIVTVALDTSGADAARRWIEAARPEHPSLLDPAHVLDELLGVVNVPNGAWIDEEGVLVRPIEPAFPGRSPSREIFAKLDIDTLPPEQAEMLAEARKIRSDPEAYRAALIDWVDRGPDSVWALAPDEVVRRSAPRSMDEARGAAEFELGQHLHRQGRPEAAIPHFRQAHRLQPDNWTYRREAWHLVSPNNQGPNGVYDSCWIEDIKAIGAENYYPPLVR